MSKERYTFEKKVTNGDNSLRFVFVGNRENINYEDFCRVIDNYFDNLLFYRNMDNNVSVIRTMFRDFDETNLYIEVSSNSYRETVRYTNEELDIYSLDHIINFNKFNNIFSVKYIFGRGIDFSFSDNKNNLIMDMNLNNYIKLINDTMEKICSLTKINATKMDDDSIRLCEAYKLFYGIVPDFTDKKIDLSTQAMVYILNKFGIKISDNYHFNYFYDKGMPFSDELDDIVRNMKPFGMVDISDFDSKLDDKIRKRILDIRNILGNDIENIDYLISFSRILYVNKDLGYNDFDIDRISQFTRYPSEQIEKNLKLVRKINSRLFN